MFEIIVFEGSALVIIFTVLVGIIVYFVLGFTFEKTMKLLEY